MAAAEFPRLLDGAPPIGLRQSLEDYLSLIHI